MEPIATPTERFFRAFEANTSSIDKFADVFMAAGPQGTQAVKASEFAVILPRRKQMFDAWGCRSTALASLKETPLDARYVLAATQWRMSFARDNDAAQDVVVDSVFIHDTVADKIVFYLASQDIAQVLKARGIIPN
ncbi:MAG TPA: hypothetical protein VGG85_17375 [Terracidiphilus sp.]|jgi:hypothetical protein